MFCPLNALDLLPFYIDAEGSMMIAQQVSSCAVVEISRK